MGKRVRDDGFVEYAGLYWRLALPQSVIPAILSITAGLLVWASRRLGNGWVSLGLGPALGLAIWTLFEYAFHRWLLHHTRHRTLRELFWKRLHAEHHGYRHMEDPAHHAVHPFIAIPIVGVLVGLVGLSTSSAWGPAVLAGWLFGYALYEGLHWLFHSGGSRLMRVPSFRHLWDAHTVHHLQRISANYGFITMFWDRRFGTYRPLTMARPEHG